MKGIDLCQKEFNYEDIILPTLKLPNPCPINIRVEKDIISLTVGPRDWEFDRKTGEMVGCGAWLDNNSDVDKFVELEKKKF